MSTRNILAGSRILLLDDESGLREELCQFLTASGLEVDAAADVPQARALLHEHDFDLVLMDLWLKQETGFDFLRDVRMHSGIPCLVMTAQDNVAQKAFGVTATANDYILKPINPRELLARLAALRRRDARLRPRGRSGFLQNQSGAISLIAALSIAMLVAIAAVVIDAGSLYYARRNLQATSDAAALAAVQNPAQASAIAASVFNNNGYSNPSLVVTTGTYTANEAQTVQSRFTASASGVNAVRVQATWQQPTYFSTFFGLGRDMTLVTQSIAARVPTASFGVGTAVARLNNGLLNSMLGQLWGSTVSLSLIDYQALATTNIQALPFLNQLASDINVSGSYQQLASSSVTVGQLINAMLQTVNSSGEGNVTGAALALQSLELQLAAATPITLSSLIDITPLNGRTIGDVVPATDPSLQLNLMSLISASARTVAAGRLVNIGTALTVPVTNSAISTRLAIGNQMVQVSMASPGSSIGTAQIRLALNATVTSVNLGVATVAVQVPIFMQAASGQATLLSMPCTIAGDRAQISASSGLTTLRFGMVSDAALQNFSSPVTPVAVPAVNVTLLGIPVQINISGGVSVASSGPTTLDFTQADIDTGTVKSVPSGSATPFSLLSTSFTLTPNVGNIPLINGLLSSLLSALNPLIASLIAPLDAPVDETLATFGLALGVTDVRVFDVSCRAPTLVG
ncbi:MAG TPA: response regulator [Rhizomicrobium sp.]|nr:response regulator [Rhizomicrobium sp.]